MAQLHQLISAAAAGATVNNVNCAAVAAVVGRGIGCGNSKNRSGMSSVQAGPHNSGGSMQIAAKVFSCCLIIRLNMLMYDSYRRCWHQLLPTPLSSPQSAVIC